MVHTFSALGRNLAVDVNSGAVHVLDKLCCDLLSLVEGPMGDACPQDLKDRLSQYDARELDEAWTELLELQRAGLLFSDDDYIDPAAAMALPKAAVVKALCLHVSHDCNLRCRYCFASTGDFGTGHRMTMDFDTAKRAIDWVVEKSGKRRNIEVDFFGGEPLMALDTVKRTVEYARSLEEKHDKCFRFTITTNGVLRDQDTIDYINREMSNVVLSLDGRREVNDHMRPTVNGKGSYDVIVPKFQQLVKARGGKGYYMRGTFTHYNTDFTNDLFHMADDLGFDELSMEPVVSKAGSPEALTEADLPILFDQYELLAKDMLRREKAGHPITFYHYMIDLAHGPCIYKRISGCGSGTEYMAVTPWGDLYPCHQFVGDPDYKLGDIWNGVTNTELRDEFKLCNVYARPDCKDCWARLYCAGGCAANALHATGDIHGVYEYGCEVFRKRIECALMIKVAESLDPELAGRAATAAPATDEDCGDCSSCE